MFNKILLEINPAKVPMQLIDIGHIAGNERFLTMSLSHCPTFTSILQFKNHPSQAILIDEMIAKIIKFLIDIFLLL